MSLRNGPHSVYGMCFSLNLNRSTSYLSLCLSLNSFCDETSRTWASLAPETRYRAFWLGLRPRHVGSSPKQSFGWVWVPIWGTWFHHEACRNLIPWPGIEPIPPALEAKSLNHWTAREVLVATSVLLICGGLDSVTQKLRLGCDLIWKWSLLQM